MASVAAAVQTFVLRVSIHCHGCKKKVRKVLRNIEGVQEVKVDAAAHKVIVTGTVDAETLVKKLQKSGKQALPWQYPPAAPAKSPEEAPPAGDGGKKNNDAAAASAEDDGKKKPEEPAKEEAQSSSSEKKPEPEAAAAEEKKADGDAEKETEPEKKAETEEAKPSNEEAKKEAGKSEAAEPAKEAGNDEATEKKSKPKETAPAATVDRSLSSPPMAPKQVQYYEGYSPAYYAPQPVMSYHMAQPRASESHYAPLPEQGYSTHQQQPPPPAYSSSSMQQQQHAYSQQPQPMQQWSPSYLYMPYPHASPKSYYHDYYSPPGTHAPPPMQDSYRIFDDENPNSCSVM